jgi:uncharacterized protein (TIGR00369 family)
MKTRDFPKHDPARYLEVFGAHDGLGRLLGHRLLSISNERCLSEFVGRAELSNPNGILHGGALFSAMDSAQGAFMHFILEPEFEFAATGTATVKFHHPVRTERLRLETTLTGAERRKRFVRSVARFEDGTLVAELDEVWVAVSRPVDD